MQAKREDILAYTNSSISSFSCSIRSPGRRDSASAAICLVPGTCRTSKSNSQIHTSQDITSTPGKSVAVRFNCATSIWGLISSMKWMPYNQWQSFLNAFRTPWHSHFPESYVRSESNHTPNSYLATCQHPSTTCMRTAPHPVWLALTVRMMFSGSIV